MKRFIAFGGSCYYAAGGFHDFIGAFDTQTEAVEAASQQRQQHPDFPEVLEDAFDWWHVYDTNKGRCVIASECQAYGAANECPRMED